MIMVVALCTSIITIIFTTFFNMPAFSVSFNFIFITIGMPIVIVFPVIIIMIIIIVFTPSVRLSVFTLVLSPHAFTSTFIGHVHITFTHTVLSNHVPFGTITTVTSSSNILIVFTIPLPFVVSCHHVRNTFTMFFINTLHSIPVPCLMIFTISSCSFPFTVIVMTMTLLSWSSIFIIEVIPIT
jgi:hypothetical protein